MLDWNNWRLLRAERKLIGTVNFDSEFVDGVINFYNYRPPFYFLFSVKNDQINIYLLVGR